MFTPPSPFKFSNLQSRSICKANPTGSKGSIEPGNRPSYLKDIGPGETVTLADVEGPGMVRHLWFTLSNRTPENFRSLIIRIYWDDAEHPSVVAPFGDFFGFAHGRASEFSTPYLAVSEGKGFNCFFPMPFSKRFRLTIENDSPDVQQFLFYQISYTLGDEITPDTGRFHAHFRRETPARGSNFVLLNTSDSPGVYVGVGAFGAIPLEPGTWREGDLRFFIDGDTDQATITGTGWSDWFLSAYGIGITHNLYGGCTYQVLHPEMKTKHYCSCYRLHIMDPIYFQKELRLEIQQIGQKFCEREDDWCSTVYWYQNIPKASLPIMPPREARIKNIAIQDWELEALDRMKSGEDRHSDTD